jgi:hypothetical protein
MNQGPQQQSGWPASGVLPRRTVDTGWTRVMLCRAISAREVSMLKRVLLLLVPILLANRRAAAAPTGG